MHWNHVGCHQVQRVLPVSVCVCVCVCVCGGVMDVLMWGLEISS